MQSNQFTHDSFNLSDLPPANPLLFNPKKRIFSINSIYDFPFHKTPNRFNTDLESIPSVVSNYSLIKFQAEESISLYEYYKQFKHCLIYSKIPLENSTVLNDQNFFATILADLNKPTQNISIQNLTEMPQTRFNSEFESGNLLAAFECEKYHYDLILQNDINTKGFTQWFFFCVQGIPAGVTVIFRIINLYKKHSLFEKGLLPAVFSESSNCGWVRSGFDVAYGKGFIRRGENQIYYMLTFSYQFQRDNDKVYFAHSYPYTYTRLNIFLNNLCLDKEKGMHINRRSFCKTLCGNNIELITITSNTIKLRKERKAIMIIARQHPGEPQGSYVMEGILRYLTGSSPEANLLREICVFRIIPMMNPDGVIHGNYRTSLCGQDMNRQWKDCQFRLHPEVYSVKHYVDQLKLEREVRLFLDLHGHSRQFSSFFYGVKSDDPIKSRTYPYLVSKINDSVNFNLSSFTQYCRKRESTARISLSRKLHSANVYTLESSFFGKKVDEQNNIEHFTIQDYIKIGESLCLALYYLIKEEFPDQSNCNFKRYSNLSEKEKLQYYEETNKESFFLKQISDELAQKAYEQSISQDSGSDSDPSEDEFKNGEISNLISSSLNQQRKFKIVSPKQEEQNSRDDKTKNQKNKTLRSSYVIQNNIKKNFNMSTTFINILKQVDPKKTSKQYFHLDLEKQKDQFESNPNLKRKDQQTQTDYYLYQNWLDTFKKQQIQSELQFMVRNKSENKPQFLNQSPHMKTCLSSERQQDLSRNYQCKSSLIINSSKIPLKYPLIDQLIQQLKSEQQQSTKKGIDRKAFNLQQKKKTEASIEDGKNEYYLYQPKNKQVALPQLKRIQRRSELSLVGFLKQRSIEQERITLYH